MRARACVCERAAVADSSSFIHRERQLGETKTKGKFFLIPQYRCVYKRGGRKTRLEVKDERLTKIRVRVSGCEKERKAKKEREYCVYVCLYVRKGKKMLRGFERKKGEKASDAQGRTETPKKCKKGKPCGV